MLFAGSSFARGGKTGGADGIGGAGGDDGDDRRDGRTPYPHDKVSAVDAIDLDSSDDDAEVAGSGKGGGNGGRKGGRLPFRPSTPPGYAHGSRVTVAPEGCSPPAGFVDLGDPPESSHTNTLYTIEEDPEPTLVANLRRWQDSVARERGGGNSSAADAARGAGSPPIAAGRGKREHPLTPTSAERERYGTYGNSVDGGTPPGSESFIETLAPMVCLRWTLEPLLHGPLTSLLDFLFERCEEDQDEELRDALLHFLAAFSTAALRLYWARRGL